MTEAWPYPEPPPPEELTATDLAGLAAWDAAGMPAGPGEDFAAYQQRLIGCERQLREMERELAETGRTRLFGSIEVSADDRVPPELLREAAEITAPLYGFAARRCPGFFLSRDVGLLWGGCLINDSEGAAPAVFFLRSRFRSSERFFIYNRRELQAHELCHLARQMLRDPELEEFFAYQTSPSRFRRYLGNCFVRQRDAFYFMVPALLLFAAQIAQFFWYPRLLTWPFWIAAVGFPLWLLARNAAGRENYFRARRKLRACGVTAARQVLFRATAAERERFRRLNGPADLAAFLAEKRGELRWQVIIHRFMKGADGDEVAGTDRVS